VARDENQTRIELIDPALYACDWTEDLIRRERTPGATVVLDGQPHARRGRTDYLLCLPAESGNQPLPVALIEAKAEDKLPSLGLQQGRNYQRRFNVPFVFSTNGHLYTTFGDDTRKIETDLPLANFPTPSDLRERYEELKGFKLDAPEAQPLFMGYKGGEAARYYFQDAAIRAALEKIAGPDEKSDRVLLSLATGTGKTVIATQLLYKLAQAGQLRRALFVCDRDELRTQALTKLQGMFGDNAQMVTTTDPARNARILVASYQTLNVASENDEPRFWRENYPPGHFSHIIIDEAHRSAWGKWSVILTDNPDAVHIGLTATPRTLKTSKKTEATAHDEAITAHNVEYFGEPVYEYTLGTGQEDGYLAACEVIRRSVDLDLDGITKDDIASKSATDPYTGRVVSPDEIESTYTAKEYETKLMLPDRVQAMAGDLFDLLLETGGPHQKTIIFCARDTHATQLQIALNNLYEEWCANQTRTPKDWFAFQCTGNPDLRPPARELIAEMKGSRNSHFIATTVDLLSTGVDIPNLENVAFFRYIESPISFYQMVGRGSRTGEPRGSKSMFRLYDYTNATRLFGEDFVSNPAPTSSGDGGVTDGGGATGDGKPRPQLIKVEGFTVQVEGDGRSILVERNGKEVLVPLEEYKEQLASSLEERAVSLDALRVVWVAPIERRKLLDDLPGGEGAVRLIRRLDDQDECDLFDVLAELAYGVVARSRAERVAGFSYKNKQWLQGLPAATGAVLKAIAGQFERGGIEELETEAVFDEQTVVAAGGFDALLNASDEPSELIEETKIRILAA
jgi:type I restriction enzyme R subunit